MQRVTLRLECRANTASDPCARISGGQSTELDRIMNDTFVLSRLTLQVNRAEGDYLKALNDVKKSKERLEVAKAKFDTLKEALDRLSNPKPETKK